MVSTLSSADVSTHLNNILIFNDSSYKFTKDTLQETKEIENGNLKLFDFDIKTWKGAVVKLGGFNEEVLIQFQQLLITG